MKQEFATVEEFYSHVDKKLEFIAMHSKRRGGFIMLSQATPEEVQEWKEENVSVYVKGMRRCRHCGSLVG